jgi:hypothetical protein
VVRILIEIDAMDSSGLGASSMTQTAGVGVGAPRCNVRCMKQKEYQIFRPDEPSARAEARNRAGSEFSVPSGVVTILGTSQMESGSRLVGWLVRVQIG